MKAKEKQLVDTIVLYGRRGIRAISEIERLKRELAAAEETRDFCFERHRQLAESLQRFWRKKK